MTENEVEDKLTSFITVFKYIDDKDIFQKVIRVQMLGAVIRPCAALKACVLWCVLWCSHFWKRLSCNLTAVVVELQLLLFHFSVLCQNASEAVNTRFIVVNGLRRGHDQQTKGTIRARHYKTTQWDVKHVHLISAPVHCSKPAATSSQANYTECTQT